MPRSIPATKMTSRPAAGPLVLLLVCMSVGLLNDTPAAPDAVCLPAVITTGRSAPIPLVVRVETAVSANCQRGDPPQRAHRGGLWPAAARAGSLAPRGSPVKWHARKRCNGNRTGDGTSSAPAAL